MKLSRSHRALLAGTASLLAAIPPATAGETSGTIALGELNCTACHSASPSQAAWISPKSAPRLDDIGTRVSAEWLGHYLRAPQETMPGTTMPDVIHGNAAQADELTHYLIGLSQPGFRRITPDRAAVARGESIYHRVGCVACHAPQNGASIPPDSIPLPRMVDKWSHDGLRKFLLDPLATRPSGRMPSMNLTENEASDVAHYLLRETRLPATAEVAFYRGRIRSLEALDKAEVARTAPANGLTLEGPMLNNGTALRFTSWLTVKQAGEYTFFLKATGASRLSIGGRWVMGDESWENAKADEKYDLDLQPGRYELKLDFVQRGKEKPNVAVEWRGPGIAQATIPASCLSNEREPIANPLAESENFVVDQTKAAKGRELFHSLNCAACHEPEANTPALPTLTRLNPSRGCLAETIDATTPNFHLDAPKREAIRKALATLNRKDIAPPLPQQRLSQTMATLRCTSCHVRDAVGGVTSDRSALFTSNVDDLGDEGRIPPHLDGVGDKLRPEWLKKVLTEGASVRPYLNTRMPQFGAANVAHLTDLLVSLDRHALLIEPVTDSPDTQRDAGRKLIGTDGLSCIACHRFNRQPAHALQVLDLTTVTARLNEDWFRQFLRDPNRFHPGTRMPALWPNGKSLLPTVLDGDTDRQHAAIWTYLSDGTKAKFPEGLSRKNMEIIVGGEPIVYRGKLWEAGFRAIATAYPGQVNTAFDAEEARLSLIWRGRFLDASPHWSSQGMGNIRPLGTDTVVFPHGSPLAILTESNTPWPTGPAKSLGMKFSGYHLDSLKRPVLQYAFGGQTVEDSFTPIDSSGKTNLLRTMRFTGTSASGLHLRIAVGKLARMSDHAYRLDDALSITIKTGGIPIVRGKGEHQELLVPIHTDATNDHLEIEYVW